MTTQPRRKFAEGTTVSVTQSQGEILAMLSERGADAVGLGVMKEAAYVEASIAGMHLRFTVPLPSASDRDVRLTPTGKVRHVDSVAAAVEAETRRKWRALLLVLKAKFEAVDSEVMSFTEEFGMHAVLVDGRTVAETVTPHLTSGERRLALSVGPAGGSR